MSSAAPTGGQSAVGQRTGLSYDTLGRGATLHVAPPPSAPITALVIEDDCGATCECHMQVDLKTDRQYFREVYRRWKACDAEVSWRSPLLLHILDDDGGERDLDIRSWGLAAP